MNDGFPESGQHPQPQDLQGHYRSVRRIYRPPAIEDKTVTCSTCGAIFAPSHLHPELRLASPAVLEAALMSMSHFCFRCRRAACPECWDHVHRICGACVFELGLPFRREVPPLEGTLFAPPPPAPAFSALPMPPETCTCQTADVAPSPEPLLTCIQAGRFRAVSVPSPFIAAIETVEMQSVLPSPSSDANTPAASPSPTATLANSAALSASESVSPPLLPASSSPTAPAAQQTAPAHNAPLPPQTSSQVQPRADQAQLSPTTAAKETYQPRARTLPPWLSLPLLTLLTLALTATLLAELSPSFNALVLRVTHIDIREAIHLFLQWVQWFH
uniref:Uncharacterized protein n=1 Tax=Thermogemmatispora argillosa TaxID=2045280 RepID=A0A455T7F8_9CHLR|nr:hypothetical protein KTA_31530 [Thermogemmatispora argillosa]